MLKNQFIYFQLDEEMQQLILWEISTIVTSFAVAALLVGGIYYTILHTRNNGGIFSDIDLSKPNGRQDILDAIDQILNILFKNLNQGE